MNPKPIVLAVDDEATNRKLLKEILDPLGYDVWLASDGDEALSMVSRGLPDLILLDVLMPRRAVSSSTLEPKGTLTLAVGGPDCGQGERNPAWGFQLVNSFSAEPESAIADRIMTSSSISFMGLFR